MDYVPPGLVIALVIVALTSTGFFAYKHPRAFAVVGKPLAKIVAYGLLFCSVWDMAVDSARRAAFMTLNDDRELIAKIDAAIAAVMFSPTLLVSMVVMLAYLMFLNALPALREAVKGN